MKFQVVNFRTQVYDCHAHSTALFDFFLATDPGFPEQALPPLVNSDHVTSESIDFHVGAKRDAVFVEQPFIIFMLTRIAALIISGNPCEDIFYRDVSAAAIWFYDLVQIRVAIAPFLNGTVLLSLLLIRSGW